MQNEEKKNHPTRSTKAVSYSAPPTVVRHARAAAGHTQQEAAATVYTHVAAWQKWEQGDHVMRLSVLELYLLKTRQLTVEEVSGAWWMDYESRALAVAR